MRVIRKWAPTPFAQFQKAGFISCSTGWKRIGLAFVGDGGYRALGEFSEIFPRYLLGLSRCASSIVCRLGESSKYRKKGERTHSNPRLYGSNDNANGMSDETNISIMLKSLKPLHNLSRRSRRMALCVTRSVRSEFNTDAEKTGRS